MFRQTPLAWFGKGVSINSLDGKLTAHENLAVQASLYGLSRVDSQARIVEVSDQLGIADRLRDKVDELSGGLRRRVELPRVFTSPTSSIMDEPTTGLDPSARSDVWNYVHQLQQSTGMTFLWQPTYLKKWPSRSYCHFEWRWISRVRQLDVSFEPVAMSLRSGHRPWGIHWAVERRDGAWTPTGGRHDSYFRYFRRFSGRNCMRIRKIIFINPLAGKPFEDVFIAWTGIVFGGILDARWISKGIFTRVVQSLAPRE